jgi:hypothetical protein
MGLEHAFQNFYQKKHGIANNSAITEARAKINTDLKSIEFWKKINTCLTKFKKPFKFTQ